MALLIPSDMSRNHFNTIRLAMALLVVWSHSFALYNDSEDREWIALLLNGTHNAGNIGVMAFFVISGYLITKSFVSSRSAGSYMVKRIKRIYPGFLVAILVCAVVVVPAYSTIMKADGQEAFRVLAHALMLKAYWPVSDVFAGNAFPGAVNGSLWSISYEFWCYLGVLALGVAGLATNRRLLLTLLVAVLLARVALDLLGWKPRIILPAVSNSVGSVLVPAGLDNAVGIVTGAFQKDPGDPRWADDPGMKAWREWMKTYNSGADPADIFNVTGYTMAQMMELVLQRAGNDLTRANLMKQTQSFKDVELPMLLPGIRLNTSAEQVTPIRQLQMARFNGKSWELFGDVLGE